MTVTTGISVALGLHFDEAGAERQCIIILANGRVLFALDAETRERVPNASECIPIE